MKDAPTEYPMIDTHYPERPRCAVVVEEPTNCVVFYADEPDCQVATGNYPGRFEKMGAS